MYMAMAISMEMDFITKCYNYYQCLLDVLEILRLIG